MKKFGMLFSTIAVVLITLFTYIYQHTGISQVNYNYPNIHIESSKYGNILNMQFITKEKEDILFLTEGGSGTNVSTLYIADLDTGKVEKLTTFEKHKNLKDLLSPAFDTGAYYTASPNGINKIRIEYDSKNKTYTANLYPGNYSIPNFDDAISASCYSNIYYTKAHDRFLYTSKTSHPGMFIFSDTSMNNMTQAYDFSPQAVFTNFYNGSIYYTKLGKNGLNLYKAILPQNHIGIREELIIENIIYPRIGEDFYPGIAALVKTLNGYGIYINGNILDEIPSETSILNQLPDMQFNNNKNNENAAYMKFNPNHRGSVILSTTSGKTEIVKDAPIIGQLRFSSSGKRLIYFTLEGKKVMVKLYNIEDKTTRDITDIFY